MAVIRKTQACQGEQGPPLPQGWYLCHEVLGHSWVLFLLRAFPSLSALARVQFPQGRLIKAGESYTDLSGCVSTEVVSRDPVQNTRFPAKKPFFQQGINIHSSQGGLETFCSGLYLPLVSFNHNLTQLIPLTFFQGKMLKYLAVSCSLVSVAWGDPEPSAFSALAH